MEATTTNSPSIPACPISLDPLKDPVILDCTCRGTVSRQSFATWKLHQIEGRTTGRDPCPNCGRPLQSWNVVPNVPLCELLESLGLGDEEEENDGGNEESGWQQIPVFNGESIHSNHQIIVSSNTTGVGVDTSPVQEVYSTEPPSARNSNHNLLIRIALAVFGLVAIIVIRKGVMASSKSDPAISSAPRFPASVPAPTPAPRTTSPRTSKCDAMQLGSDLDGEVAGDYFGYSVSLSSDGNRLAVGARYNDGNGTDAGHVRVFDWSGNTWQQLGSDLDGEAADDWFGYSVSLSSDGNRLAVGAIYNGGNERNAGHVRVFDWSGNTWQQLGSDLDGEAANDWFGYGVSLSSDGNRLVVGAPRNDGNGKNAGHVRVFDWTGSTWVQVGFDLDGEAADDQFGYSVSLSSDGHRLAVGAPYNDGNGDFAGHVRVFYWSGSTWKQLGPDLDSEAAGDEFGISLSLSSDGNRLVVGAPRNDGNGQNAGHVRVFEWSGNTWQQLGFDLDGEVAGDYFGRSVSLSSDGNRLAVGAVGNDGNEWNAGHVRVFDWSGSTWIQLGSDLDGEAAHDWFGYSVSVSSNGNRLAVGAIYNDGNGDKAGHVRVFELEDASCEA